MHVNRVHIMANADSACMRTPFPLLLGSNSLCAQSLSAIAQATTVAFMKIEVPIFSPGHTGCQHGSQHLQIPMSAALLLFITDGIYCGCRLARHVPSRSVSMDSPPSRSTSSACFFVGGNVNTHLLESLAPN